MTRTHLITGAGSGIGAAVARELHARGDELILIARSEERAHDLVTTFDGARVVVGDLAEPAHLETVLAAANLPPRLDSLLHVAGVVELGPVAQLDLAEVRAHLDVNLVAPMIVTKACLPALRAAHGLVLVVNSTAGITASASWSAYAASKFGARGFADALRAEEQPNGVRVTSVFPSRTATPMQEKVHDQEERAYDPDDWIRPESVASSILHVLDLPRDATVPELTLRPGP